MDQFENHCLECDWSRSTEHHSMEELGVLTIEHYVDTGHTVESYKPSPELSHD